MQLSPYFKRSEFRCKCNQCDCQTVDAELLMVLNDIREKFGPTTITSAHRCPTHNKNINGASKSTHLLGSAVDFRVKDLDAAHEYLLNKYPDTYGIARGNGFIHCDVRSKKSRWTYK